MKWSEQPLPFRRAFLQLRVRHQTMPDDDMKGFRVRRHQIGVNRRHNDHVVPQALGVSAVAPDNAEYGHAARFRGLESANEVDAYVFFKIAAAD